ncbi:MAG: methylated-DNA--[protein]-cysteine S-methyltransferase [Chloroflexi bacterium]|nr:methylated-DNA--[protein]-cysteine S-methyltransferase [Chloroflexota bacterium]OJV86769.1 MAG: cysteine methyltransferase [Chloroflexi bacterium 54-19]
MELFVDRIESEIGEIVVVTDGKSLVALDYADYEPRMRKLLGSRYGDFTLTHLSNPGGISDKVRAYLSGDFHSLDDIPVNTGGTPFQQEVWQALRTIPAGTFVSYKELAQKVGRPTAYRAVGMTNSLNPVAIVLPCHRVVGANAALTGYAGGLERKRWLLRHEGAALF